MLILRYLNFHLNTLIPNGNQGIITYRVDLLRAKFYDCWLGAVNYLIYQLQKINRWVFSTVNLIESSLNEQVVFCINKGFREIYCSTVVSFAFNEVGQRPKYGALLFTELFACEEQNKITLTVGATSLIVGV
jgi:hypothetical protein